MNLQNYYYYFQSALTPRFCDELVKYGKLQQEQIALTGGQTEKVNKGKPLDDKDILDLKKKRDSNIAWLNDRWIYKEIQPFIHQANRLANWNFDWDFQSLVNLQNMVLGSTMELTVILGRGHTQMQIIKIHLVKLGSSPLLAAYQIQASMKVVN